jgi:endonuclease YncB( thermonuclease family)
MKLYASSCLTFLVVIATRSRRTLKTPMQPLQVAVLSIFLVSAVATNAAEFSGRVKTVIDGDDIELCDGSGACTRIRLCGIDAPERTCPGYGAAREGLRAVAEGKQARCIQVGSGTPCDGKSKPTSYNRIVAQCFVDGTDVAGSLVERGLACDWERFSGGYYSRGGKGRLCPPNHRGNCTAVSPQ